MTQRLVHMTQQMVFALALAAMAWGCGSSSASVCEQACSAIQEACMSRAPDCVADCEADLVSCPDEMGAVLDCVLASELQCDPAQDQGLAEAPCQQEHAAVAACGADPF